MNGTPHGPGVGSGVGPAFGLGAQRTADDLTLRDDRGQHPDDETPRSGSPPRSVLHLDPRSIGRVLYGIIAALALIHIGILVQYYRVGDPDVFDFVPLFDLDCEGNIPSLFSCYLFLANVVALLVHWGHARAQRSPDALRWLGLALVFFFLSLDEGAKLHEQVGDMMGSVVQTEGFLNWPWFIPYLAGFAVLVVLYLPFYRRLPRVTRRAFFVAAAVFITGAAGLDILGGREAHLYDTTTMTYSALYTAEEVMEMVGLVLFLKALLFALKRERVELSLG